MSNDKYNSVSEKGNLLEYRTLSMFIMVFDK